MDKVIFLDIDGVLNSNFWEQTHTKELSDGTLVDAEKVALLGGLVRRTGAQLILHSGWRFWYDGDCKPLRAESERLSAMLAAEGMTIAGVTPDLTTEEIRRTKKFSLVKAREILAWVAQHPETTGWVVLEDLDLHNGEVARHQVMTDQTVGLTEADVETAVGILENLL
ncbi:MAG: hypothetical protein IKM54_00525 [Butyricicoccus sp.]|nr:hypothetical protein [Butyricicoccus sp.]